MTIAVEVVGRYQCRGGERRRRSGCCCFLPKIRPAHQGSAGINSQLCRDPPSITELKLMILAALKRHGMGPEWRRSMRGAQIGGMLDLCGGARQPRRL